MKKMGDGNWEIFSGELGAKCARRGDRSRRRWMKCCSISAKARVSISGSAEWKAILRELFPLLSGALDISFFSIRHNEALRKDVSRFASVASGCAWTRAVSGGDQSCGICGLATPDTSRIRFFSYAFTHTHSAKCRRNTEKVQHTQEKLFRNFSWHFSAGIRTISTDFTLLIRFNAIELCYFTNLMFFPNLYDGFYGCFEKLMADSNWGFSLLDANAWLALGRCLRHFVRQSAKI